MSTLINGSGGTGFEARILNASPRMQRKSSFNSLNLCLHDGKFSLRVRDRGGEMTSQDLALMNDFRRLVWNASSKLSQNLDSIPERIELGDDLSVEISFDLGDGRIKDVVFKLVAIDSQFEVDVRQKHMAHYNNHKLPSDFSDIPVSLATQLTKVGFLSLDSGLLGVFVGFSKPILLGNFCVEHFGLPQTTV